MARKAGKHDGLAVIASALKREQGKLAKRSSKKHVAAAKKKAESSDSESDSDESVHNLESPIPRKKKSKATKVPKKRVLFDLMDQDSSDEDEKMPAKDNNPTAEEMAFLRMIKENKLNELEKMD
jgi:hypothetical protein